MAENENEIQYLSRYILCEICTERPATLSFYVGDVPSRYICDRCAQENYPDMGLPQ